MLQSMGLQRVRHDLVTEQQRNQIFYLFKKGEVSTCRQLKIGLKIKRTPKSTNTVSKPRSRLNACIPSKTHVLKPNLRCDDIRRNRPVGNDEVVKVEPP